MDKLKELINIFTKIPKDKLAHFFGGSVLFTISMLFFTDLQSTVITVLVAAAKEVVWDGLLKQGTVDFKDFVFSVIPVIFYFIQ
jgi:hypothetical protein